MLQNRNVNIDEFISFNSGGLVIADYDQIQKSIITRYKEAYGEDIDVSNTTADGVFINDLALIINNILQSFKTLYNNLNVDTASGSYLDMLCRLSNVTRKGKSKSIAYLTLDCTEDTVLESGTLFIDTFGNEWLYEGVNINLTSGTPVSNVLVTCTEFGPVEAPAGSITQTLEVSFITVEQLYDAKIGSDEETDEDLRARRDQSNGANGITVTESLIGALLDVDQIKDAQVIVNASHNNSAAQADGKVLTPNSVYIIIRKRENFDLTEDEYVEKIGGIIYNTLTPGIATNSFIGAATNGIAKSYTVPLSDYITDLINTVNWKEAVAIHPQMSVVVTKGRSYSDDTTKAIIQSLVDYMNNLQLSKTPVLNDVIITVTYADINAGYSVGTITLPNPNTNPNTYYNYVNDWNGTDTSHVTVSTAGNNVTITIK